MSDIDLPSLFERLGGVEGITAIANDVVERHKVHPVIAPRFLDVDDAKLKELVRDFFITGSGGPECYTGRDMEETHTGMNLNEAEFLAALDDCLAAVDGQEVDAITRNEVMGIFYSFKDAVLHR